MDRLVTKSKIPRNHRGHHRWQYSLRGLFCLLTIMCILFGSLVWGIRVRAKSVREMQELGLAVEFRKPIGFMGSIKVLAASVFGHDGIYDVVGIFSINTSPPIVDDRNSPTQSSPITMLPVDWAELETRSLSVMTQPNKSHTIADDSVLQRLAKFPHLAQLSLRGTGVSDDGLKYLGGLRSLTSLTLSNTSISDKSVSELSKLRGLKSLDLMDTKLTRRGLLRLHANLPNCRFFDKVVAERTSNSFLPFQNYDTTLLAPAESR